MNPASVEYRTGYVALGGRSNVGKSTLLNRLVGEKVAIVTPRPQTTRRRILGIRTEPDAQLILIDAPGIHQTNKLLNQRMVATARHALSEADVVAIVVEAAPRLDPGDREILADLARMAKPKVVIVNKLDLMARPMLLPLLAECAALAPEAELVPVSALSGENIDELSRTLKMLLPKGPALMPEEQYTDQSERALSEEVVREKIFLAMRQEVPFSTAVTVEDFEELAERDLVRIRALVLVERKSHKGMLIGAGGQTLKHIGQAARLELEKMFGHRVYLELIVKVEENWTRDPRRLAELGL